MKIEIFFDLNSKQTKYAFDHFKQAYHLFIYHDKLELTFKSYEISKQNILHQFIQFVKREYPALDIITEVLNCLYELKLTETETLAHVLLTYKIPQDKVNEALSSGKYAAIIRNHEEHAVLKKVKMTPHFIFENKVILSGEQSVKTYLDKLIEFYEYESKQEYCEDDDCKR